MDPRQFIRQAAENEAYHLTEHALQEADKDNLSVTDLENVMLRGIINQRDRKNNRYRLRHKDVQIVVEICSGQVIVVTVMKDKKEV